MTLHKKIFLTMLSYIFIPRIIFILLNQTFYAKYIAIYTPALFFIFLYRKNIKFKKINITKAIFLTTFSLAIMLLMQLFFFYVINPTIGVTQNITSSNNSILIKIFLTGVITPIVEELFFRGIITNSLEDNEKVFNFILNALLFTLPHVLFFNDLSVWIYTFMTVFTSSLILMFNYVKTKNIIIPIIIHSIFNLSQMLLK